MLDPRLAQELRDIQQTMRSEGRLPSPERLQQYYDTFRPWIGVVRNARISSLRVTARLSEATFGEFTPSGTDKLEQRIMGQSRKPAVRTAACVWRLTLDLGENL